MQILELELEDERATPRRKAPAPAPPAQSPPKQARREAHTPAQPACCLGLTPQNLLPIKELLQIHM